MMKYINIEMFNNIFVTFVKGNLNKFINFYLRLVNLPTIFVTKKVSLLFTIILFYSLTLLYIKNIFFIYTPGLIKFSLSGYPYVSVNGLFIAIVLITSTYTKFNLFIRIINLIRCFTYIPEFWKEEKKLILVYIIYSSILGFFSCKLIYRIDSIFSNSDLFSLYLSLTVWLCIVMTLYRIDIIFKQFNNKNVYNKIGKNVLKFSLISLVYFFILYLYITKVSPAVYCDGDRSRIITRSDSEYDSDSSNPAIDQRYNVLTVRGERTLTRVELERLYDEEEAPPVVDTSIPRIPNDRDTIFIDSSVPAQYKPWYYFKRTNTYVFEYFFNGKYSDRTAQLKERAKLLAGDFFGMFKRAWRTGLEARLLTNEQISGKFIDECAMAFQPVLNTDDYPNIPADGVAPSPIYPSTPINSSNSSLSTINSISSSQSQEFYYFESRRD